MHLQHISCDWILKGRGWVSSITVFDWQVMLSAFTFSATRVFVCFCVFHLSNTYYPSCSKTRFNSEALESSLYIGNVNDVMFILILIKICKYGLCVSGLELAPIRSGLISISPNQSKTHPSVMRTANTEGDTAQTFACSPPAPRCPLMGVSTPLIMGCETDWDEEARDFLPVCLKAFMLLDVLVKALNIQKAYLLKWCTVAQL